MNPRASVILKGGWAVGYFDFEFCTGICMKKLRSSVEVVVATAVSPAASRLQRNKGRLLGVDVGHSGIRAVQRTKYVYNLFQQQHRRRSPPHIHPNAMCIFFDFGGVITRGRGEEEKPIFFHRSRNVPPGLPRLPNTPEKLEIRGIQLRDLP